MKNSLSKAIAIFLAFCVAFSGLPFLAGNLEANALAKKKKTPKNITLQAAASGQTQAVLKWNKIKSPSKGYAVFRDGEPVKHFNTKKTAFTDNDLEAGTSYTYQIKTYTKKTVKMWFNKKTEKWQKKKPAKKYRGKSRKETVYTYKKKSNAVTIRTTTAPAPATPSNPSDTGDDGSASNTPLAVPANFKVTLDESGKSITLSWDAVPGATGYYVYKKFGSKSQRADTVKTTMTDKAVTEGVTYTYAVRAIRGSETSNRSEEITCTVPVQGSGGNNEETTPQQPAQTKTVTDYLGVTRTFTKKSNETSWLCTASTDGRTGFGVSRMNRYDRTLDGTFYGDSNHEMRTYHGATFDVTEIENLKQDERSIYYYIVEMYNGDPSRLEFVLDPSVQIKPRDTFEETGKYTYTPKKKYFFYKNGHPIARTFDNGALAAEGKKEENEGYTINRKVILVDNGAMAIGDGVGIWTGTFDVTVKYDGEVIGTIHVDTASDPLYNDKWTTENRNGISPFRRKALEIAQQALKVKGESGDLDTDLNRIDEYVKENYSYAEPIEFDGVTVKMTCYFGAIIMETYSIYKFGEYGFEGSGSRYNLTNGKHSVFVLDKAPHVYYQTQGKYDGKYDSEVGYF